MGKLCSLIMDKQINNLLVEFIVAVILLFLGIIISKFGWVLIVFSYVLCGDITIASLSLIKKIRNE
jgi:hypothetical protein